jgi:DnaK suppressor protein
MSKGLRNADATQYLTEKAIADTINEILELDREQAAHSEELKAKGAYGLCESCGKEIGAERLEALPSATRCIACQASWEQANRT